MKMKRIANDLALQTIGYSIGRTQEIDVFYYVDGYQLETVFRGKFEDFEKIYLTSGKEQLSYNRVMKVETKGNILCIGIDR